MGEISMGLESLVSETFARLETTQLGAARPERVAEQDYRSFCDALGASKRGRAFLHEYARRNRHADTEVVLAALSRLEQTARAHRAEPEAERIRQDLRALLESLRGAKPQIDNSPGAIKAATLAAMLEFVQSRLEALISPRTTLQQVSAPEQPELPMPQPAAAPTVLSLVQAAMAAPPPRSPLEAVAAESDVTALKAEAAVQKRLNSAIPEVSFFDNATVMPAAEPVTTPAKSDTPKIDPAIAQAPKPVVEPYELWLDPGLAGLMTPEPKPAAQQQTVDAQVAAQVEADLTTSLLAELPAAPAVTVSPPKPPAAQPMATQPATAQPTTAIAALAATFIMTEEAAPAQTTTAAAAIKPAPAAKATALKSDDPLALIMALSEAERLALFT